MLPEKMMQINTIQSHLQKIEDLISFYETQAAVSGDAVCGSFLKNVADKKSIQLIILERMLRKRGIEIFPLKRSSARKNGFSAVRLSQASLEDIYEFISKQSLNDFKALMFLSLENLNAKPIYKAMGSLEEDFLNFVQCDYLHHLSASTLQAGCPQAPGEKAELMSVR
jgi:hypothetical protein